MGWNGSDRCHQGQSISKITPKCVKRKPSGFLLHLLTVLFLVSIIILCFKLFLCSKNSNDESGSLTRCVSEPSATPIVTTRRSHQNFIATNMTQFTHSVAKPVITMADVFFNCKHADGRPVFVRPVFSNSTDNLIASLLSEEPGTRFLDLRLDNSFDEQFIETLKYPITVSADEDEDVRLLKEVVIDARRSIEKYMQEGMKPSEVVASSLAEMNKIADYKDLLQKNYEMLIAKEDDIEIVKLYVNEANLVLDEYGASHLRVPEDDKSLQEDMDDARETKRQDDDAATENQNVEI